MLTSRMPFCRHLLAFLVLACLAPLGCYRLPGFSGDGDDARNSFHERDFLDPAEPGARLEYNVMIHLEPTGTDNGDSGTEEGVDEIPYDITHPVRLGLGIPLAEQLGHRVELLDSRGTLLAFAEGAMASDAVALSPGRYAVRVYHADRGSNAAATEPLFLRATVLDDADADATGRPLKSDLTERVPGQYSHTVWCEAGWVQYTGQLSTLTLWLSGNVSCGNFVGADYSAQSGTSFSLRCSGNARNAVFRNCNFDGATFSGALADSQFVNCTLTNVRWDSFALTGDSRLSGCDLQNRDNLAALSFSGVTIENCNFQNCLMRDLYDGRTRSPTQFVGCTFRGNRFDGADFISAVFDRAVGLFSVAAGNTFNGTIVRWTAFTNMVISESAHPGIPLASITAGWQGVDFSGSTLSGMDLSSLSLDGAIFVGTVLDRPTSRATLIWPAATSPAPP